MKAIFINYNFTPSWIHDYDFDYLIYDRSESDEWLKDFPQERIIKTENIGNADYDRQGYLVEHYDDLPDVFLWSKSNLFKYISKGEFDAVKDNRVFTPLLTQHHKTYEPVCRYVDGMYEETNNSWYAPQFEHKFANYNEWARYVGLPTPEYLAFPPGGNFILTREAVHKHPKALYEKMRDTLAHAVLPAEAHYCERSYLTLWS